MNIRMRRSVRQYRQSTLSGRQRIVLTVAAVYFSSLAFVGIFSMKLQDKVLPGVQICYVWSGYIDGKHFETILSHECINIDEQGSYIWLAVRKETPLGERVYVKRQDVEVAAAGDGVCAIRPIMELNAEVVEICNKELYSGEQVKVLKKDDNEKTGD